MEEPHKSSSIIHKPFISSINIDLKCRCPYSPGLYLASSPSYRSPRRTFSRQYPTPLHSHPRTKLALISKCVPPVLIHFWARADLSRRTSWATPLTRSPLSLTLTPASSQFLSQNLRLHLCRHGIATALQAHAKGKKRSLPSQNLRKHHGRRTMEWRGNSETPTECI